MTARDVPGVNDVGPAFMGDPIFADGLVEYHGQSIFAVAATSMALAREAAAKAVIEYEILQPILTIDEALAAQTFVLPTQVMQRGDADAALAKAPLRLSGRIDVGGQEHFYLEGQVAMAIPGEDGDMLVHSSTQHPDRGAASGRPRAEAVGSFGGVRDAADGRRVRRQGVAGVADRGGGGAAGAADRTPGEAPAGPRRRHDPDRQAAPLPDRLRCRVRQGRPHPGHQVHAGDRLRLFPRPVRRDRRPGDVSRRQCLLSGPRPHRLASLQDQHRIQHRVPRLWRTAGHGGDRACGGRDRPASAHRSADRPQAQLLRQARPQRHAVPHDGRGQRHRRTGGGAGTRGRIRGTPQGGRGVQRGQPVGQARAGADAGEVRHLVHADAHEPGRRTGACLYRRQRAAEPRRHRDGPGPVPEGRADRRRRVRHRPGPGEDHRDDDGEGAEHVADGGVLGHRSERQGGASGGASDQAAHGGGGGDGAGGAGRVDRVRRRQGGRRRTRR